MDEETLDVEDPAYSVDPANIVVQQADLVRRVMAQVTEMHLAISLRDAAISQLREQVSTLEARLLVGTNGHLVEPAIEAD